MGSPAPRPGSLFAFDRLDQATSGPISKGMTRSISALTLAAFSLCLALFTGQPSKAAPMRETAIFAGGCFWCVEHDMKAIPGVVSAVSGYTGGHVAKPTYEDVTSETSGHLESVKVTFDPTKISYGVLVGRFMRLIDPTDAGGQFCDRGQSYQSAIFVNGPVQRAAAQAVLAQLQTTPLKGKIVTPIRDAATFWPAEGYHQDFSNKNPLRYNLYRQGCGRDARVKAVWRGIAP